jgi:hypothetical protein
VDLPLADLANVRRLGHGQKAVACVEASWQITIARASRAVQPRFRIAAFPPIDSRRPAAAWGNHDENSARFARRAPRSPELLIHPGIQVRCVVDRLAAEFSVCGATTGHTQFAERLSRNRYPFFLEVFGGLILVGTDAVPPVASRRGLARSQYRSSDLPPSVAARSRRVTAVTYSANQGVKRRGFPTFRALQAVEILPLQTRSRSMRTASRCG